MAKTIIEEEIGQGDKTKQLYHLVKIDGCEYIMVHRSGLKVEAQPFNFLHKGDCSNPIHNKNGSGG